MTLTVRHIGDLTEIRGELAPADPTRGYAPVEEVRILLTPPTGSQQILTTAPDEHGAFFATWTPPTHGTWQVRAVGLVDGTSVVAEQDDIVVRPTNQRS